MLHVFQATSFTGEQSARVRKFLSYDTEGLNHVALALLRHKCTGATEEELPLCHAPPFSRSVSFIRGNATRDFHAFIDNGDAVRRKSAFDKTSGNVSAIGYKAIQHPESCPGNPVALQGKTNPSRGQQRQLAVSPRQPGRSQGMGFVCVEQIESIVAQKPANLACRRQAEHCRGHFVHIDSRSPGATAKRRSPCGEKL